MGYDADYILGSETTYNGLTIGTTNFATDLKTKVKELFTKQTDKTYTDMYNNLTLIDDLTSLAGKDYFTTAASDENYTQFLK